MREYVIATDSTTDMKPEYYAENGVECIGMQYNIEGKEYVQFSESSLSVKEFYDAVRGGAMPKTSQIPYAKLYGLFERLVNEGKDVFYLSFSSALSGSYQTSVLVANDIMEKYPECKIKVVDSISACTGEGLLLYNCVKQKNNGLSLDELAEYAEEIKHRTIHLFTVDDLNHLHRGGRLSKMSAVFGSMLGIKPLLYFNDLGQLLPYSKVRGRRNSLDALAKQMEKTYIPEECGEIFISSGDANDDAEYLGKLIQKMMPAVKTVHYGDIGAVIGTHSGPNTIALFYIGKTRVIE